MSSFENNRLRPSNQEILMFLVITTDLCPGKVKYLSSKFVNAGIPYFLINFVKAFHFQNILNLYFKISGTKKQRDKEMIGLSLLTSYKQNLKDFLLLSTQVTMSLK